LSVSGCNMDLYSSLLLSLPLSCLNIIQPRIPLLGSVTPAVVRPVCLIVVLPRLCCVLSICLPNEGSCMHIKLFLKTGGLLVDVALYISLHSKFTSAIHPFRTHIQQQQKKCVENMLNMLDSLWQQLNHFVFNA